MADIEVPPTALAALGGACVGIGYLIKAATPAFVAWIRHKPPHVNGHAQFATERFQANVLKLEGQIDDRDAEIRRLRELLHVKDSEITAAALARDLALKELEDERKGRRRPFLDED